MNNTEDMNSLSSVAATGLLGSLGVSKVKQIATEFHASFS